jgi:alanyl-tRNA synthetase
MTEKLYYQDSKRLTFTAQIVATRDTERGPAVRLDRTAFYPTGGGQAHDTGTLDGIAVRDVWTDDVGEIWHLVDRLPEEDTVEGEVNGERRFDHMQQHTGQHLLSAAFIHVLDGATHSVHFGTEENTVDLDLPHLSWEAAYRVEDAVNRIIWQDRPVQARFVAQEQLDTLDLRREPQVEGKIRVVSVQGYEATPCGGTHVARTGEIGAVKITSISRYKGGVRVGFLCGRRALHDYRRAYQLLETLKLSLTVGQDELPDALERLQAELKETHKALRDAEEDLNALAADRLWEKAPIIDGVRYVVAHWPQRPFDEAQAMAKALRQRPKTVILLATGGDAGVRLVCACSDDVDADAGEILRAAAAPLNARGGGSPAMAQGGGPPVAPEAVRPALEAALPVKLS